MPTGSFADWSGTFSPGSAGNRLPMSLLRNYWRPSAELNTVEPWKPPIAPTVVLVGLAIFQQYALASEESSLESSPPIESKEIFETLETLNLIRSLEEKFENLENKLEDQEGVVGSLQRDVIQQEQEILGYLNRPIHLYDPNFWVPIVIAGFALFVSIWHGYQTRKHNRLGVTPKIRFDYRILAENTRPGLFLLNAGMGPAIIKQVTIFFDEKPIPISSTKDLDKIIQKCADSKLPTISTGSLFPGEFLKPNEERDVLATEIVGEKLTEIQKSSFNDLLTRWGVKVEYFSIYKGKPFVEKAGRGVEAEGGVTQQPLPEHLRESQP